MVRGVVALCYDVDNKVPKLIAWRRGNIQIGSCRMGNCVAKVKNHCSRVCASVQASSLSVSNIV